MLWPRTSAAQATSWSKNADESRRSGAAAASRRHLVDVFGDDSAGLQRALRGLRVLAYKIPERCCAGYYPECNVLTRIRALGDAWQHAIGNVIAVLVSLFSFYWRYRNGAVGVLPTGLMLSLIVICIILFTGWKGGEMVFRHRVAVYDEPPGSA